MKRTFGKILSFALVLAMVLSMVPAVLAAPAKGDPLYLAPGETRELTCKKDTIVNDKTITATATYWLSSNESAVRVVGGSDGTATITAVGSSSSYYGYSATISAYEKASDANSSSYNEALMTWNVTVTNWAITLSTTTSGSYDYGYGSSASAALEPGASLTLKATVTGPKGRAGDVIVGFASQYKSIATVGGAETTIGSYYVNNSGNGESTVSVAAAGGNGPSVITAYLLKKTPNPSGNENANFTVEGAASQKTYYDYVTDASGNPITKTFTVTVGGQAGYDLTLPDAQQNMTIVYNATLTKLTPTLKRYGQNVSNKTFVYTSSDTATLIVDRDGTLYPQSRTGTATVTVTVSGMTNTLSATSKITIVPTKAGGVTIDVGDTKVGSKTISAAELKRELSKGNRFFGVMDTTKNGNATIATPEEMLTSVTLTATVDSDNASDASRVQWSIPAASKNYISFASNSSKTTATGANVTVYMRKAGTKVTLNASVDGSKDATYTFDIWQGVCYKNAKAPAVAGPISSIIDTIKNLKERDIEVKLVQSDNTMYLPVKDVTPKASGSNYQFEIEVDGKYTSDKTFYYPINGNRKVTTDAVGVSAITIEDQPESSVTYKLDGTSMKLTVSAYTSDSTNLLKQFIWYDGQGRAVKNESLLQGNVGKAYGISTLDLSEVITAPGSYSFYCKVIAMNDAYVISNISSVSVGGEYFVQINLNNSGTIKPGDVVTASATPQQYNPLTKRYVDVTGKNPTISWTSSDTAIVKVDSTGTSVKVTAVSGGTAKLTAKTTIDGKEYTGTKDITVTVPAAEDVRLTLEEDATYVMLDGGKLSDAVKKATSTTPSTFSFTLPTTGTIYSSSSLSSSISAGNKYSASDVSRMAFKPSRSAGSYTIDYAAYGTSGQIATGKLVIMTNAGTVSYHISANESQTMQVSDFQSVYGSGLSYVKFGTASDSRGALYKGSSTSSGKVGSESYYVSTGTTLLKNVTFIAGSSTAKYSVVIPFTAYGSNGEANGNLVIYVNDTHSVTSTGATFKSMAIADELAPESNASSAYITITSVVGGKLYTQYSKINSCTALAAKDLGSTRFSFSGSNSIDNLYVLPLADSKTVEVNYTINGSDKGTLTFKVVQQTASSKFTDVSGSFKWAANSVDFMYGNGLVNGISTKNPNVFGPGQNMTRAMLVTILYRAAGEPSVAGITNKFTDNKQNQYYYEPVLWASSKGIVNGATATTFDPDGKITREQIAAILYRYAGSPAASSSALNGFADQSAVSSYAVTAMQWAVGNGIITGVSTNGRTTLSAKNNATRAQVSVMLHRFLTMEQ